MLQRYGNLYCFYVLMIRLIQSNFLYWILNIKKKKKKTSRTHSHSYSIRSPIKWLWSSSWRRIYFATKLHSQLKSVDARAIIGCQISCSCGSMARWKCTENPFPNLRREATLPVQAHVSSSGGWNAKLRTS